MPAKLVVTTDDKDVQKALDAMVRKVQKLTDANRKLATESRKATGQARRGASALGSQLKSAVAGYMSVSAAIGLVNRGIQKQIELQDKAAGIQTTIADAQAKVIKNIGDATGAETKAEFAKVRKLTSDIGFQSEVPLLLAYSSIISATGSRGTTMNVLREVAPLFRDQQEDMPEFGGALADVMKATGDDNAKRNAALILAMQSQLRLTSFSAFKEVAPALGAAALADTSGDDLTAVRQGGAMFSALGKMSGDITGATSKTAVSNLARNLRDAVPELQTSFARLAAVQASPELQEQVLASGFKGAVKMYVEDLVRNPRGKTATLMHAAYGKIQGSEATLDMKVAQLRGLTPELQNVGTTRAAEGITEQFLTSGTKGRKAMLRKILDESLTGASRGGVEFSEAWGRMKIWDLGGGSADPQAVIAALEARIRELEGKMGLGLLPHAPEGMMTDESRENVGYLKEQIAVLREIKAGQRPVVLNAHTE